MKAVDNRNLIKKITDDKGNVVATPLFRDEDYGLMMYCIGDEVYYLASELKAKGASIHMNAMFNPLNKQLCSSEGEWDMLINTRNLAESLTPINQEPTITLVEPPIFTYLALCETTNTIKIGISKNPKARLGNIQTSHPFLLSFILILEGNREKELHQLFSAHRLAGEWFNYSTSIKKFVEESNQMELYLR